MSKERRGPKSAMRGQYEDAACVNIPGECTPDCSTRHVQPGDASERCEDVKRSQGEGGKEETEKEKKRAAEKGQAHAQVPPGGISSNVM